MMIFKQVATASTFLSSLIVLGSFDASLGRLRGGIKGDYRTKRGLHIDYARKLNSKTTSSDQIDSVTDEDITYGVATGVTAEGKVISFGDSFSASDPIVFTNLMTYNNDGFSETRVFDVEKEGFGILLQETTPGDYAEDVGYMAFDLPEGGDSALIKDKNGKVIGKVGRKSTNLSYGGGLITWEDPNIGVDSEFVAIVMSNSYDNTFHIQITQIKSYEGDVNVAFSWNSQGKTFAPLELVYMFIEVGVHALDDGKTLRAERVENVVDHDFTQIDFEGDFRGTPAVLGQPQSTDAEPIVARMKDATESGIAVRLQDKTDGELTKETVGLVVYGSTRSDEAKDDEMDQEGTDETPQFHLAQPHIP